MKWRFLFLTVLLALFVVPAFADSLTFTNQGGLSVSSAGISADSTMTGFSVDGKLIESGKIGGVYFDTGTFIGSLKNGGSFSGGDFSFGLFGPDGKTIEGAIFADNFTGTLTKIGKDLYDLVGTFSGIADGVAFKGTTNQILSFGGDDDHRRGDDGNGCWRDLHGTTTITGATVPEPSTLTFLGTGLIALAGVVRRKLGARV